MLITCSHPTLILNPVAVEKLRQGYLLRIDGSLIPGFDSIDIFRVFDCSELYAQRFFGSFPKRDFYPDEDSFISAYHSFVETAFNSSFVLDEFGECYNLYQLVPCGKCDICKESKRNDWSSRCTLESQNYDFPPLFITLTYDNEHCDGSLHKRDLQLFLKRLRMYYVRKRCAFQLPEYTLRYFACGEYGSFTSRPHYHLMLWNYPIFGNLETTIQQVSKDITYIWRLGDRGRGFIDSNNRRGKDLDIQIARSAGKYIAKYVSKSFEFDDSEKEPPFLLFSRKPAIGFLNYFYDVVRPQFYNNPSISSLTLSDKHNAGASFKVALSRSIKSRVYPSYSELLSVVDCATSGRSDKISFRSLLQNHLERSQNWLYYVRELQKVLSDNIFISPDVHYTFDNAVLPYISDVIFYRDFALDKFSMFNIFIPSQREPLTDFSKANLENLVYELAFPYENFLDFFVQISQFSSQWFNDCDYFLSMSRKHTDSLLIKSKNNIDVNQFLFNIRQRSKLKNMKEKF
ncbi:replication initiator protein [Capybara microvirus Cap3_SP_264]|nr:replication initiator protein [Capybara microvirus Cap3_SP_264]